MNIFYLDNDPVECARAHNNSHVVKMILETAQLLSTAHRALDGVETTVYSDSGRKTKRLVLKDSRNDVLYQSTHVNHPSAVWARQTSANYYWLHSLFVGLLYEYKHRYEKEHKCMFLLDPLNDLPNNITYGTFTEPTPAMPVECIVENDSIASYRNYYINNKQHIAQWTKRNPPVWYVFK